MRVEDVPIIGVSPFVVPAVLETEPIPPFPVFDGEPLTLKRLDDESQWPNKGRRRKALRVWAGFVAEVNAIQAKRGDKLYTALMFRGVNLPVPPLADFAPDMVAIGVSDPVWAKLLYIDHLLPEPDDKLDLLVRVMEKSGLESGNVEIVRGLFRAALQAANIPTREDRQRSDSGLEELDEAIQADLEAGEA